MPPQVVHIGQAAQVRRAREKVLKAAFDRHPERLVRGLPKQAAMPEAVWINQPKGPLASEQAWRGDGAVLEDPSFAGIGVGRVVGEGVSRFRQSASAEGGGP